MFNLKTLKKQFKKAQGQRGAFSPFMFGMLAGLAVFSGALRTQYLNELGSLESQRYERLVKETTALEDAVRNYIRTEITASYSDTITVANIQELLTTRGSTTDSGQAYQINIINETINFVNAAAVAATRNAQVVLMTPSDDSLLRAAVAAVTTKEDAFTLAENPHVTVVSTESIRQEQVALSKKRLEAMAALLYDYYTRGFFSGVTRLHSFPRNTTEYNDMITTYNLGNEAKDSWGAALVYTVDTSGNTTDAETGTALSETAVISFTAPWGERYPATVSVRQ